MWFRVEVAKDGGIVSCEPVEASVIEGRHVRYVEAETKAEAISTAKTWWERNAREVRHFYDVVQPQEQKERREQKERLLRLSLTAEEKYARKQAAERRAYRTRIDKKTKLRFAQKTLNTFDRSTPRAFRVWLVSEIARLTPKGKQANVPRSLR